MNTQSLSLTRELARRRGDQRFNPGVPCRHGHVAERMVSNGRCVACRDLDNRRFYRENREDAKAASNARRAARKSLQHDAHIHAWAGSVNNRLIARDDAKQAGLKRYFSGKPCRNGHLCERLVSTGKCVECHRRRLARQRASNPDKYRRKRREYAMRNRSALLERAARSRQENPEKHAAATHRWRKRNYDRYIETMRSYYRDNLAEQRARSLRKNADRDAAEGTYAKCDVDRIWNQQGKRCALCKCRLTEKSRQLDHIKPLSRGGTNWPRNLQWLCRPCNQSKHAKDPLVHARQMGFLL